MSRKTIIILCLGIALIVVAALGVVFYSAWKGWTSPWGTADQQFLIEIERGMTAEQIGELLLTKGVLKGTTFFLIMADLRGFGGSLKAGEYMIRGDQSPAEVVGMIGDGQIYRHPILIPEGVTRQQIAEVLEKHRICTGEEFLRATSGGVKQDVGLQGGPAAAPTVEGYLFPDTYHWERNVEPDRILKRMMRRFNQVYLELTEEVQESERWWQIEEDGSVLALVTVASLVEREAKRSEDRPLVASVFRNRLKKDMPLQSEATIRYITDNWQTALTKEDFEIDSPYNTFKNKGLPLSPICNPGRESLRAAMRPAKSDYLYFMATGDGKTEFSTTLREHNEMRKRVRQEGAKP